MFLLSLSVTICVVNWSKYLHHAFHFMLPVKYWVLHPSSCFVICVKSSQAKAALQNWYFIPSRRNSSQVSPSAEGELQTICIAKEVSIFILLKLQPGTVSKVFGHR